MEIRYITDVGLKRENNEDYVGVYYNHAKCPLVILADGMGGHNAGDVASKQATTSLGALWQETSLETLEEVTSFLTESIQKINEDLFTQGEEDEELSGMGTTIVAGAIFDDEFVLAHVGDSRAYLIRSSEMIQLTEDHSLVNDLRKAGEITNEEAENFPRKNIITRSVGMPGVVNIDVINHSWEYDDYLLLASDGLTDLVSDEEILNIMKNGGTVTEKIGWLRDLANQYGGKDNISILVVRFERGGEQ